MADHSELGYLKLPKSINDLKPHDHLCLIYESREEWLETVVPFISTGLEHGEKCIYIIDANTAQQIKTIFKDSGIAVEDYKNNGQLSIIHEQDTYTREGFFDPDSMIALLIEETKKALQEGFPALRVTGEMSWALRDYSGVEKILEYEAKLNKDLFQVYPCMAICQYDRWKYDPKTIQGVVLTHPLLIRGGQIYRNHYYIEPDEYLNHKQGEFEVQVWLNNLERERKSQDSLQKSEEKYRRLFETMVQGVVYHDADGKIISVNPAAERILGLTFDQMLGKTSMDPRWQMIEEDGTPVPGNEHPAMIALRTGQVVGPLIRGVYHPDQDNHIWLRITATPLFLPGVTKPFQVYAVFENITERKQAEKQLRFQAQIIENTLTIAAYHDKNLNVLWMNRAYEKATGLSLEECRGRKCYQVWNLSKPCRGCPVITAIETGEKANAELTPANQDHWPEKQGCWLSEATPVRDEQGAVIGALEFAIDITEHKAVEENLKKIEWMLSQKQTPDNVDLDENYDQGYGDLTELNSDGIILKSISPEILRNFSNDYMELLGTSSAIYEANGNYAFGIFSSGWCRMMDRASRQLCNSTDNIKALNSGRWLCHESCWNDCSKEAILKREPVEIECSGGIRLYAVPIIANEEVVGAINFGYGDPPEDREKLQELADTYQVNYNDLVREAHAYETRPPYIIKMAKNRLHATARLIGSMIETKQAEAKIIKSNTELEQRVKDRTIELEAVNKELASFAYSISHDFRAPLRALDGFSASLTDKYSEQLDEQGLHYLDRIRNAAIYMSDLIDDLLELSRITRAKLKEQEVDISHLSKEILKDLLEAEPERRVKVEVAQGLSAKGDIALLKSTLENLIGNAWKYSSKEAQAEIEVGRTTIDGGETFFIRDNGVGFNMAYADKLFGAFQRLHRADEFPGTGIGLATVQRIINRHGGQIWAESAVGKGATFYFTLKN
jgi:PAS domain S-box-containing protein